YANTNNFTHIIIGRPRKSWWQRIFQRSLTHDLIDHAGDISVHVISGDKNEEKPAQSVKAAPSRSRWSIGSYLNSTLFVALAIVVGIVLDRTL
ncbi:hypothetical protein, partial [Staphylococcus aureus]